MRLALTSALFTSSFAVLAGCAALPAPAPPPPAPVDLRVTPVAGSLAAADAGDDEREGVTLVWGHIGDAPPVTYRVAGNGAVVREEPGVIIATSRGEWRWDVSAEAMKIPPCEIEDGRKYEPGEGRVSHASLVLLGGRERQEVIAPPEVDGLSEIEHFTTVAGSVGPYLFIEEWTHGYACGAYGSMEAESVVWDVQRGAAVDLLAEVPDVPVLQRVADAAINEDEGHPQGAWGATPPKLVEIKPAYDARGWLRLEARLAVFPCTMCGDGSWSSHARSAVVPARWAPARFAAWAYPPPGVETFLAHRRGFTLGGWSRSGGEER